MATQLRDQHFETAPMIKEVSADDIRREHDEALRLGPQHPDYARAKCILESAKNASGNLDPRTVEEMLQETFEAFAETRNRHQHIH